MSSWISECAWLPFIFSTETLQTVGKPVNIIAIVKEGEIPLGQIQFQFGPSKLTFASHLETKTTFQRTLSWEQSWWNKIGLTSE